MVKGNETLRWGEKNEVEIPGNKVALHRLFLDGLDTLVNTGLNTMTGGRVKR
jgi:hypothetical protein